MQSTLRRAFALGKAAATHARSGREPFRSYYSTKRDAAAAATGLKRTKSAGKLVAPPEQAKHDAEPAVDWPRPSEIPFQAKVANSVNLIGRVHMPVQFQAAPDGKFWAGTVITRDLDFSADAAPLWIPTIFEGDLAHIAACHLKEHDRVHISGQLSADPPPFDLNQGQANVQVIAQSINFVEGFYRMKQSNASHKYGKIVSDIHATDNANIKHLEEEVLTKPNEISVIRLQEADDQKDAEFGQKGGKYLLPTGELTSVMKMDNKLVAKNWPDGITKNDVWRDLLDNPRNWLEYRKPKLSGLVNQKHPDFKCKDGTASLWLDTAPKWVLSRIDRIEFEVGSYKSKPGVESGSKKIPREHQGDEAWKNLVQNPEKWWDNRLDKRKSTYPDFRHKDTGEGLWLDSSPSWVLEKLPPLKTKKEANNQKEEALSS